MRPIATPAAGLDIGTPASIRARLPPHTVAIEDDPNMKRHHSGSHNSNNIKMMRKHKCSYINKTIQR
jgi:hypothetical protein